MANSVKKLDSFQIVAARPKIVGARVGRIVSVSSAGEVMVDFPANPVGPAFARYSASLSRESLEQACRNASEVLLVFDESDASRPVILDCLAPLASEGAAAEAPSAPDLHGAETDSQPDSVAAAPASIVLAHIARIDDGKAVVDCQGEGRKGLPARTCIALRNLRDPVLVLLLPHGEAVIVGQIQAAVLLEGEGDAHADIALKGARVTIEAELGIELRSGVSRIVIDANGQITSYSDRIVSRARGANKVQGGSVQLN